MSETRKAPTHKEKYEEPQEFATILWSRFNDLKHDIHCQKPCKVVKVHANNQVDLQILDKDSDGQGQIIEYPIIPNVPIRQAMESGKAYIRLPVQLGDTGTIEFFDSSVDDIITESSYSYSYEEDWHSLSDGLFTNGFLPDKNLIDVDPNCPISIGTKSGTFTFIVNDAGQLTLTTPVMNIIAGTSLNITAPTTNITGVVNISDNLNVAKTVTATTDVIGGGKSLKSHTHPYTDNGSAMNTSAPN